MEVEEIQAQSHKFPRIGNRATHDPKNPGSVDHQDAAFLDLKRATAGGGNHLRGWHHSRIIRVSRASGGKDRHSKVWTSKGLRDRRVRLSVTTAIQFYDLQDRLGYDQPSKAVEWLIKAAGEAISELPPLNSAFPDTPKQLSDENRASCEHGFDSAELEMDPNYQLNPAAQNQLSKSSACSSTSETSKGSGGLSLSRSEIKVNREKARVRARERAAKDKEKESNNIHNGNISQNATFTELLTGGIGGNVPNSNNNNNNSPTGGGGGSGEPILFHKAAPMDYFNNSQFPGRSHHSSSGFSGQIHLGMNSSINPQTMSVVSPFNQSNHSSELQHLSFVPDHLIPVSQSGNGGGDYNLNFSISSSGGLAGFNRGTLQSNSSTSLPSLLPHHLQRFSHIDGSSNVPFFFGAAATAAPMENHHHQHHHEQHQFASGGFDLRLQQLYSDGTRHSDHKGKSKN